MSIENSLSNSREGERTKSEQPAVEAAERQMEQEVVEPVDIVELGKVTIDSGEAGFNPKTNKYDAMKAEHITIDIDKKYLQNFGFKEYTTVPGDTIGSHKTIETKLSVPLSGKVRNEITGVEENYAYEYSKLSDGQIVESRLKSKFSDGNEENEEVVEKAFDDKGRVAAETDTVNGELVAEALYSYDEKGKRLPVTVRRYRDGKMIDEGQYSDASIGGRLSITGSGQGRTMLGSAGYLKR